MCINFVTIDKIFSLTVLLRKMFGKRKHSFKIITLNTGLRLSLREISTKRPNTEPSPTRMFEKS